MSAVSYRPPLVLPAMALAVIMAWSQSVCWLPIKSQLVHGYSMVIGIYLLLGVPFWFLVLNRVSSPVVTVIGLIELPVICTLALFGLAHARRGDDWSFGLQDLVGPVLGDHGSPYEAAAQLPHGSPGAALVRGPLPRLGAQGNDLLPTLINLYICHDQPEPRG